jgi:hypothetical protein
MTFNDVKKMLGKIPANRAYCPATDPASHFEYFRDGKRVFAGQCQQCVLLKQHNFDLREGKRTSSGKIFCSRVYTVVAVFRRKKWAKNPLALKANGALVVYEVMSEFGPRLDIRSCTATCLQLG